MEGKQCSMSFEDIWGSICNEIGVAEIFLRPPLLHMYSFTQLITAQDNPEHPETLIILCISVLQSLQYNCGPLPTCKLLYDWTILSTFILFSKPQH